MYHLKLIKGRSYTGAVKATKAAPDVFTEDEGKYRAALESGFFVEIKDAPAAPPAGAPASPEEPGQQDPPNPEPPAPEEPGIDKMTEKQLRQYAEENGISLTGCSTKGEVLQKIKEHEADVAAAAAITGQGE